MPSANAAARHEDGGWTQPMLWLGLAMVMLLFAWLLWRNPPNGLAAFMNQAGNELSGPSAVSAAGNPTTEEAGTRTGAALDEPAPAQSEAADAATDASAATIASESSTGSSVPVEPTVAPFDRGMHLRNAGRPDLAALPVVASLEGSTLTLEGTVQTGEQLAAIEFQARLVPGVETVLIDQVNLVLPPTYIVQEGDTLWGISVRLYGEPTQVDAIYAANQDVMASPNALSIGMELKVPPVEVRE